MLSPFWIGESYRRVHSGWGNGKEVGRECGNGVLEPHATFSCKRYRVQGGFVQLGFARGQYQDPSQARLVSFETTSPHYKTRDGIGVGFHIRYGRKRVLDGLTFRYKTYANFPPTWESTTYPPKPEDARCQPHTNASCWQWMRAGRVTELLVKKGVVVDVMIQRGDFWYT